MSNEDTTPPPPAPPVPTAQIPVVGPEFKPKRSWKTWQLVTASLVALILGIAIGTSDTEPENNAETADTTIESDVTTTTDGPSPTDGPTATTSAPTTTTQPQPDGHVIGDKVTYDDGSSIQIYSYEQGVKGDFFDPEAGNEFAVIDVEVCAGTNEVSYNELAFAAVMADNRRYSDAFGGAREPGLSSGDLPAGSGCVRGWATLEVPMNQRPVSILWSYGNFEDTRWLVK